MDKRPIIIMGGFLSKKTIYAGMQSTLSQISDRPVHIVNTRSFEWLLSISKVGWAILLDKLDHTVKEALTGKSDCKATLVGHSAGKSLTGIFKSV